MSKKFSKDRIRLKHKAIKKSGMLQGMLFEVHFRAADRFYRKLLTGNRIYNMFCKEAKE